MVKMVWDTPRVSADCGGSSILCCFCAEFLISHPRAPGLSASIQLWRRARVLFDMRLPHRWFTPTARPIRPCGLCRPADRAGQAGVSSSLVSTYIFRYMSRLCRMLCGFANKRHCGYDLDQPMSGPSVRKQLLWITASASWWVPAWPGGAGQFTRPLDISDASASLE
jgi:hypothetical protein